MPNDYSVEIHNYISREIELTEQRLAATDTDLEQQFFQGKLDELQRLRKFLQDNIDLKDFNYF